MNDTLVARSCISVDHSFVKYVQRHWRMVLRSVTMPTISAPRVRNGGKSVVTYETQSRAGDGTLTMIGRSAACTALAARTNSVAVNDRISAPFGHHGAMLNEPRQNRGGAWTRHRARPRLHDLT